jgi:hypothetical protein
MGHRVVTRTGMTVSDDPLPLSPWAGLAARR